ncbi:response regulator transcription factor [Tunturiibacter lichenicola]|uniref:response regulator transcription factor n=1 Tax=Tunturiibacter lichenicola TaxID=2051959 RepID=UPI0021B2F1BD|nr:response regulator [Edaphobacter lichenicola]
MDLVLTGSRLDDGTSSPTDHRLVSTEALRGTPIIYVVEPDEAERESLKQLIECEGWHPETFASAEEFLAHPLEVVPSCLLLDVSLPGINGLELQKRAAVAHPHLTIIFLSAKGDIPTAVEAMKAGAVEFFMKPFLRKRLLSVFREALDRSRKILTREAEKRALRKCYASLSYRQQQVMALVSSGLLNKQVGMELGISEITVKAHRGQVMQKMQADSFSDLIKMAAKLGVSKMKELPRLRHGESSRNLTDVLLDS